MERVLVITYYWPPAGGPGVQRWLKWVKYLPSAGVLPMVLTLDPNCAEYPIRDESLTADVAQDIQVRRTPAKGWYDLYKKFTGAKMAPYSGFANEGHPNLKQKLSRFIRGNFFLPDLRKGWNPYAIAAAEQWLAEETFTCIITTGPPMSTHLIGKALKKRHPNLRWIADFRDPWTDIYYYDKMYPSPIAKGIDRRMEKDVLQRADAVIGVSPFVTELLKAKLPALQASKFFCLTNGFDPDDYPLKESMPPEVFTICYTGTMADNYPMNGFIKAVKELQQNHTIRLRFIGKIAEPLRRNIEQHVSNAHFEGFIPHHESVRCLQESSLLLLVLPIDPGARDIIPGKVFEYVGSGTPTLCLGAPDSDAGYILQECQAGRAIEPEDADTIRTFLEELILSPRTGRLAADPTHPYSRIRLAERLVKEVIHT